MNFAYLFRLACLCLATFFLIQAALSLAARAVAPAAIRFAERLSARSAARLLLSLRLLPAALALLAVGLFCLPSYLRFEPEASAEKIGLVCSLAALFGAALWTISFVRVLRAAAASSLRAREWRRRGESFRLPDDVPDVLVIEDEAPLLALSGVFHSRLIASRGVLRRLSPDQLRAALRHENAHHASRDNLKRLLLLLAPDAIPFIRGFASLDRAWSRFTEWAADDRAVAGDAQRSLSLAEALVCVSRMGASPRLSPLLSTLTGNFASANFSDSERNSSLPASEHLYEPHGIYTFFAACCKGLGIVVRAWFFNLSPAEAQSPRQRPDFSGAFAARTKACLSGGRSFSSDAPPLKMSGALAPEDKCAPSCGTSLAPMGSYPPIFSALLTSDDGDLSARVNRLLQPASQPEISRSRLRILLAGATLAAAGLLTAALLQPATFYTVHRLLEHLVR
jgi:Zn-dependent protease with chaperone function